MRNKPNEKRTGFALLFGAFLILVFNALWASPFTEVPSSDPLYKRVQALGQYGLLDAADQALMDRGETVTRLQLAFTVEKARANMPIVTVADMKDERLALMTEKLKTRDNPVTTMPVAKKAVAKVTAAEAKNVTGEIESLLTLLKKEDAYLRSRLVSDEQELQALQKQLDSLETRKDVIKREHNKANQNAGSPNLVASSSTRFESISTWGLQRHSIITAGNDIYVNIWADLGGKASISTGFSGFIPFDNVDKQQAVTVGMSSTRVQVDLTGRMGGWNLYFFDTAYDPNTSLGDFTRSGGGGAKRYEDPFNIQAYTSEKVVKNWDSYIRSIGFVETRDVISNQSSGDLVFDGVVLRGANLPYLASDAKLNLLAGRLDSAPRFEYAGQFSQPWMDKKISTSLSCMFVQDSFGALPVSGPVTVLDLRNYEASAKIDLAPVMLSVDGAFSRMDTGVDNMKPAPEALKDVAANTTMSFYPLNIHYSHIGPNYSNSRSKVTLTSIDHYRYGLSGSYNNPGNINPGYLGESDVLASNRRGWRVNLGWDGRRTETLREWLPKFMDYMILNANVSQKTEFASVVNSTLGPNRRTVDVSRTVDFYYPEWRGIMGQQIFGGWDDATPMFLRNAYKINTQDSAGVTTTFYSRYEFRGSSEVYALIDPATGKDIVNLRSYNYFDVTNKWQVNKLMGWSNPLYLGIYYGLCQMKAMDHTDSDLSANDILVPADSILFTRRVGDVALFFGNVVRNVHLMTHYAGENWKSDSTAPHLDTKMRVAGFGFTWDIPWGAPSKFDLRYNHLKYESGFIPENNYRGDQIIGLIKTAF